MAEAEIKRKVYVNVEHYSGQEEGEDDLGHPYYVAFSDELHFVTEGDTFEELMANIRECLLLTLHDGNSVAEFGVAPDAQITILMDLPENYAEQTA
jgi:predicted RNase H-like HicB family nuclease